MPVQIQMAQPADLAGEYLKGVQTSAQIREAQQRLQAQQAEAQQRAAQQQQEAQKEHDLQQQRIAVTQAYQQQQIGLRKQQLDQVKAVNDAKTASAARQFQARQQWQQGFSKIDADPNMTPEQKDAAKTSFTMRMAPMMGVPGTEASAMLRDMRPAKPTVPASVQDKGDFWQVTQPGGGISIHPKPKPSKDAAPKQATIPQLKAAMDATDDPDTKSRLQQQINGMASIAGTVPMTRANAPDWIKQPIAAAESAQGGAANVPQGTSAPKTGDVEDGHVFKGGDPSDPANWTKVDQGD